MCSEFTSPFVTLDWLSQKHWPIASENASEVSIADLFCGCGGLTLGATQALQAAGYRAKISLAVDTSSAAAKAYRHNFNVEDTVLKTVPIEELFDGPLGTAPTSQELLIRSRIPQLGLLLAGPPCQGHSDLNNRSRRNDTRNLLYLRAIRAAEILRPSAILIENVPSIIHDKHEVVSKSISALTSLNYKVVTTVINALSLGLPQNRKRHLLIATSSGEYTLSNTKSDSEKTKPSISSVIADLIDEPKSNVDIFKTPSRTTDVNKKRISYLFEHGTYDLPHHMRPECHSDPNHSYKSMYGRLRWNKPAQTITGGFGCMGQGRFVHPKRRRTLTPHEAARIQGFPDFFSFESVQSRTELHEIIGNAVPPILATVVVQGLIAQKLLRVCDDGKEAA